MGFITLAPCLDLIIGQRVHEDRGVKVVQGCGQGTGAFEAGLASLRLIALGDVGDCVDSLTHLQKEKKMEYSEKYI
jgi:hypothetical protein